MDKDELEARIQERTSFLERVAKDLVQQNVIPEGKVVLRSARIPLLVHGYFALSECYKKWRIQDKHNTEPAKIAALTACSIITFQPFASLDRTHASTYGEAFCNEIFAAAAVCAILEIKFDIGSKGWKDFWLRNFDILKSWPGQTLEPFRTDINLSIDRDISAYFRTVHDQDQPTLNSLISIFELLGCKLTPAAKA